MARKVTLEVTAKGDRAVNAKLKKTGTLVKRLGQNARGASTGLQGMYGVVGGIGLVAGAKRVLDFDKAIGQLEADMGITTDEASRMRLEMLGLSESYGVAKEDVLAALGVFQDFGGIVNKGRKIMDGLTKVAKATGTPLQELATIASTLMQTLNMTPEDALKSITTFNEQALQGQISMRKLAKVIPSVLGAGVARGFKGTRAIQQLGTLLQVAGQATGGNVEEARTQAMALMRDLFKASKILKKEFKIEVLDKNKNLKDIDAIMAQVIKSTKGTLLDKKGKPIFTEESIRVAGIFKSMFDDAAGKFRVGTTVTKVGEARGDTTKIDEQLARRIGGVAKEAESVEKSMRKLDSELSRSGGKLIQWFASDLPNSLTLAVSGALGVKFAGAATTAILSLKGVGAAAGIVSAGLGPLIGALGAGVAAGTALDRVTGASDKLADFLFELFNPEEAKRRTQAQFEAIETKTQETRLVDPRGPAFLRKEEPEFLTKPEFLERGNVRERTPRQRRVHEREMQKLTVNVEVQNKTGIDGITASAGRGKPQ